MSEMFYIRKNSTVNFKDNVKNLSCWYGCSLDVTYDFFVSLIISFRLEKKIFCFFELSLLSYNIYQLIIYTCNWIDDYIVFFNNILCLRNIVSKTILTYIKFIVCMLIFDVKCEQLKIYNIYYVFISFWYIFRMCFINIAHQ